MKRRLALTAKMWLVLCGLVLAFTVTATCHANPHSYSDCLQRQSDALARKGSADSAITQTINAASDCDEAHDEALEALVAVPEEKQGGEDWIAAIAEYNAGVSEENAGNIGFDVANDIYAYAVVHYANGVDNITFPGVDYNLAWHGFDNAVDDWNCAWHGVSGTDGYVGAYNHYVAAKVHFYLAKAMFEALQPL